jgi:hypothetical protein
VSNYPDPNAELEIVSEGLFNLEQGLSDLLETIVRMSCVYLRDLSILNSEDIDRLRTQQRDELEGALLIMKNLFDRCRKTHRDLGVAMTKGYVAVGEARKRVEDELNRKKNGDTQ